MALPPMAYLAACIFAVALLYSRVGHGGASAYVAVLAIFGLEPSALKPAALALNILVSATAFWNFSRAGHFRPRLFWPFAAVSIPFSFLGGAITLPGPLYRHLLGIALLASAVHLAVREEEDPGGVSDPPVPVAFEVGAVLGFFAGLTGIGGGVFLSPLLLLMRWGKAKEVAAASSLFILVNSAAALLGHVSGLRSVPPFLPVLAAAALAGGFVGSRAGSFRIPPNGIVRALSVVLVIAGVKLLFL